MEALEQLGDVNEGLYRHVFGNVERQSQVANVTGDGVTYFYVLLVAKEPDDEVIELGWGFQFEEIDDVVVGLGR